MTKKELLKRIELLEQRVAELEARPVYLPLPIQPPYRSGSAKDTGSPLIEHYPSTCVSQWQDRYLMEDDQILTTTDAEHPIEWTRII